MWWRSVTELLPNIKYLLDINYNLTDNISGDILYIFEFICADMITALSEGYNNKVYNTDCPLIFV